MPSPKRSYEEELIEARQRNKKRLARIEDPTQGRCIYLKVSEVATLNLIGEVEIIRPIWPPALLKQAYCQWIQPGWMRWVAEDVKWFGANPEQALYRYSDDPEYAKITWQKAVAKQAPKKSWRICVECKTAIRSHNSYFWRIGLKKCLPPKRGLRLALPSDDD